MSPEHTMVSNKKWRVEGPRILLRPLELDDVTDRYVGWLNDPLINQYLEIRFERQTSKLVTRFVDAMIQSPDIMLLGIILWPEGRHIGNIKLGPIDRRHRRAEISIFIGERDCWGMGYATEAISLLTAYSFAELNLHKMTAGAYSCNPGSVRAFTKVGFVTEALLREHYFMNDKTVDRIVLAAFASDISKPQGTSHD